MPYASPIRLLIALLVAVALGLAGVAFSDADADAKAEAAAEESAEAETTVAMCDEPDATEQSMGLVSRVGCGGGWA